MTSVPAEEAVPLVRLREITKRFGAITALDNVSVDFFAGQVHGLVGANGAGKSTLIKVLAGATTPDLGTIAIDGEAVTLGNPAESRRLGLSFIYQELSLVPKFSILQNLALGNWERTRSRLLTWRALRRRGQEVLDQVGLHRRLDLPVESLSVADAWLVSIGRALMTKARLIAMDEPTASLSAGECERLFTVVRDLASSGVSLLYVSHRLDEVVDLSETVTIFRDGQIVDTLRGAQIAKPALIRGIVGGDLAEQDGQYPIASRTDLPPVLSVRGLSRAPLVNGVNLDVQPGEVVGLAGLVGSGRTEVVRMIFGAERADAGSMHLDGAPFAPRSVYDAIKRGVALVPEERRSQALFLEKTVEFNINLPTLRDVRMRRLRLLPTRRRDARSAQMVDSLGIKTRSVHTPVSHLSGGNQQKVVMAKWLVGDCRILLLDEPSRGVDVSARGEIYRVIRQQTAKGTAAIVISSEFDELRICDRVVILREGRVVAELGHDEISESAILEVCFDDRTAPSEPREAV